jgi:restriction endonuclease Mrr
MSVPGYQSLMAPVLSALADGGDHSLAELRAILAERLSLTEDDLPAVLHYVRDVTMREDAQRLRAGTSAQVVVGVRNTAVAALRLAGFTGVAAGRRRAARNPARPLAALNLL